jgi:hypothetical protein
MINILIKTKTFLPYLYEIILLAKVRNKKGKIAAFMHD